MFELTILGTTEALELEPVVCETAQIEVACEVITQNQIGSVITLPPVICETSQVEFETVVNTSDNPAQQLVNEVDAEIEKYEQERVEVCGRGGKPKTRLVEREERKEKREN